MKRVMVYSHDTYGLGNIRRMLAICEHLCEVHSDISILIVSGSPMLHAFRLSSRIDYVKLPCLSRTRSGSYEVKTLGLDYGTTIAMRAQILECTMLAFEPDLVLVDKKPFGVDDELRPALEAARGSSCPPAVVLMLRDILDDPVTTIGIWRKNCYYEAIETFFDLVLVLGSEDVFDLVTEYRFPPQIASMVEFCGYLARRPGTRSPEEVRQELGVDSYAFTVLVTPGGGDDGAHLIDSFVGTAAQLSARGVASIVVPGPELPDDALMRLHRAAEGVDHMHVIDFTDDMASYIGAADLVVCMAGYNTICEVLSADRPIVAIPRVRPVREQLIRAELMAEAGLLRMIHPNDLTPATLFDSIAGSVDAPLGLLGQLDMQGLDHVEKHLARLIGDA